MQRGGRVLILAIDVGTTHCKAALFGAGGAVLGLAVRDTPERHDGDGNAYYLAAELWAAVATAAAEAMRSDGVRGEPVGAVAITSMAETGLLLEAATGAPRSEVIPWHDRRALPQFERMAAAVGPEEAFRRSGARMNFKSSLSRILWLRERDPDILPGSIWLSASDYVAYRLTGRFATDYSLAGRTGAFDIAAKCWDEPYLARWGLEASLFPPAYPGGTPVGAVDGRLCDVAGLHGATVAVAGHDHVCGARAADAAVTGALFDSMGTAETLVGAFPERPLGQQDFASGLAFGCHVLPAHMYWMGATSTSGGSIEWLRSLFGDEPVPYSVLASWMQTAADAPPTGIFYLPYLRGSGSPRNDVSVRAAFVGLDARHGRPALLQAVLEGVAYELEWIRRTAAKALGIEIREIVAAGGGARMPGWLQIKADISGCEIVALPAAEASLLGAALTAAGGAGLRWPEAGGPSLTAGARVYRPHPARAAGYRRLFEDGYLPLQESLRAHYTRMAATQG